MRIGINDGRTVGSTLNECCVSFVNAGSAISSSGAYSTVRGTSTAEASVNKEAGLAGKAGGSSSIEHTVRDKRVGHTISTRTSSVTGRNEADVSGDLVSVVVELLEGSSSGGGRGSYIN